MMEDNRCECGKDSVKGCHGIKDGEVFSIYYCDACYNNRSFLEPKEKTNEDVSETV